MILLPFSPFSDVPPIMIGGGPGTWFLLGYVLYMAIAVGVFPGFSALLFTIETYEGRRVNARIMLVGIVLLFIGVTVSCVLLAVAGAIGGYALTIQHSTVNDAQNLLVPYVNPIMACTFVAVAGTLVSIFGMITASKAYPT